MRKFTKFISCLIILFFLGSTFGCDAFVRKFTREKKHQEIIEPVLSPEEHAGLFYDNDTKYKNYFAYWRAWQDELIQSLSQESKKRRRYCINQAIENLQLMAGLLTDDRQKEINDYIEKMNKIRRDIESDQGISQNLMIQQLSNIRLSINNKLHFSKVKDWIKK